MGNYNLNSGFNNVIIPRTETVANIVYSGALGTAYGIITVESNRTTPLTMNINNLKFGNVVGQPACIDFGNNNLQDNKLIYSGTNVILNDSNVSGETNKNCAIRVVKGTMLTIISSDSSAELQCKGDNSGAGIGGNYAENGGNITIDGEGTLNITAGYGAAAIGGGGGIYIGDVVSGGNSGNILIKGSGTVIATSDSEGAAIGSGSFGIAENITIQGTVEINSTNTGTGAGIGSAQYGRCENIIITGSPKIVATGGSGAAGIGGGYLGKSLNITISIVNPGTITATGRDFGPVLGNGGAGIGGGGGNGTIGGDGGNITIYGTGDVKATGGEQGAGIGGGDYGCGGLVIVVGWGTVSAKNGGGIAPNPPQDIGKGGHCPNGPMDVVLSNPNFQNVNDPVLVKIKILLNGQPYANKTVTLIMGESGALRLDTKTDSDGYVYFYATEGTYAFTATEGSYTLEEKFFTVPPMSNVPTELVFSGGTNVLRGINLFGVKK